MDYNLMIKEENIDIEPRLREYLNKKKYYKEHNIEPAFSIEKEYSITNDDLKLLKEYLNGNTSVYKYDKRHEFLDLIDTRGQKFESPDFKQDERFKRFQKKMERTKNAQKERNNWSGWNDGNIKLLPKNFDVNERRINIEPFDVNSRNISLDNDYILNDNNKHKQNMTTLEHRNDSFVNNIIGMDPSYRNTNKYNSNSIKTNNMMPDMRNNTKKYYNTARYKNIPSIKSKDGLMNVDIESNLRLYENYDNSVKSKSIGYKNPSEHYYQYVSDEYNNPDNFVLPFPRGGESTRQMNRVSNRTHRERQIY